MTLHLINPTIHDTLPPCGCLTLIKEPYVEGYHHLFAAFSKGAKEATPTASQRIWHLLTGISLLIPIVNLIIYLALFILGKKSSAIKPAQGSLPTTPNPSTEHVPALPGPAHDPLLPIRESYRRSLEEFVKAAHVANKIQNPVIRQDIDAFITSLQSNTLSQIDTQNDQDILYALLDNVHLELTCIASQIEDLIQKENSDHLTSLASIQPPPEAVEWLHNVLTSLRRTHFDESEWNKLFENPQSARFLNQPFREFAGGTLLHYLAKKERNLPYTSRVLPQRGVDLARQDTWDNTALIWAIANASNTTAMEIIKAGGHGPYLNVLGLQKNSALHLAVGKGYKTVSKDLQDLYYSNLQLTQALVEAGANVNLANEDGNTPLHLAYLRRDVETIKVLLRAGAHTQLRNNRGQIPEELWNEGYENACKILDVTVSAYLLDRDEYSKARMDETITG